MKVSKTSRKYARALFEVLGDAQKARHAVQELGQVDRVISGDDTELRRLLKHPEIKGDRKAEIVQRIFGGKVDDQTLRVLTLLARRGRIDALPGLVHLLDRMVLEAEGVARAEVTTAIPMDDGQRDMVHKRIGQLVNRKIELQTKVDPSLIGGIVIKVGDRLIDGSVRYHLEKLREGMKNLRIA
jgi:F-type H+-transporting ATPase subunit delta